MLEGLKLWRLIQPSFAKTESWTLDSKTEEWMIGHVLLALLGSFWLEIRAL